MQGNKSVIKLQCTQKIKIGIFKTNLITLISSSFSLGSYIINWYIIQELTYDLCERSLNTNIMLKNICLEHVLKCAIKISISK